MLESSLRNSGAMIISGKLVNVTNLLLSLKRAGVTEDYDVNGL